MADFSPMMSQTEIAALKEALSAQQRLLQKLYHELEAEREASATAAHEALSVILRLQGEKAAVKMEAEQYKRLAEEKMCHAEESFAVIEDIITEKEMEMADLDYQVQTYKYQLVSYGLIEPDDDDIKIPDNLMHKNEHDPRFVRRNSAPSLVKLKKGSGEGEIPEIDNMEENVGQEMHGAGPESSRKGESTYADQIRELELRVKEITGANFSSPMSLSAQPSVGNLCPTPLSLQPSVGNLCSMSHETRPPSPEVEKTKKCETRPPSPPPPPPSNVHDVFEVPQADEETGRDDIEKKDRVHSEVVKPYVKSEPDWLKKLLHSTHDEKHLCKPSDIAAIERGAVQPSTSGSESVSRVNGSSEIGVVERVAEKLIRRDEEMELLKDIREKLNLLQQAIRSPKVKEPEIEVEIPSLEPLSQAMIFFWL